MDTQKVVNDFFGDVREGFEDVGESKKLVDDFFGDIEESDVEYFCFLMRAAESVEDLRKEKGLSQLEAGRLSGNTQAMISKYESGDYNPSIGKLWKYVRALGAELHINIQKKVETFDYSPIVTELRKIGETSNLIRLKKEGQGSWDSTGINIGDGKKLKGVAV